MVQFPDRESMKNLINLLLFIQLIFTSTFSAERNLAGIEHGGVYKLMKKDPNAYLNWMWLVYSNNMNVDLSKEEKTRLNKMLLKNLPHVKFYTDGKIVKVRLNDDEFLISEINVKDKSFKIDGKFVQLDNSKGFKTNLSLILDKMDSNHHSSNVMDYLFPSAYGVANFLVGGLVILAVGVVGTLANAFLEFSMSEDAYLRFVKMCEKRDENVLYENSRFYRNINSLLSGSESFKIMYETLKSDRSCLKFENKMLPKFTYTRHELKPICKNLNKLIRCEQSYVKESEVKKNAAVQAGNVNPGSPGAEAE